MQQLRLHDDNVPRYNDGTKFNRLDHAGNTSTNMKAAWTALVKLGTQIFHEIDADSELLLQETHTKQAQQHNLDTQSKLQVPEAPDRKCRYV
jgi:hypothetical protein